MSIDASAPPEALVQVRDLKMHFPVTEGAIVPRIVAHAKAADGISFDIRAGETLGLVGEPGCGKTTTDRCILKLEKAKDGCVFHPRCNITVEACKGSEPEFREIRPGHWVACSQV
ncbi:MAG: ATP-binding cassette domain-containing protein [Pseudomonadota bacterium]